MKITDAVHEFILYKQSLRHVLQEPGAQAERFRPLCRAR